MSGRYREAHGRIVGSAGISRLPHAIKRLCRSSGFLVYSPNFPPRLWIDRRLFDADPSRIGVMTKLVGLSCLVLLVSCLASAYAQSISSGTVTGVVTDPSGGLVRGARVQLRNPVTGYEQSVVTDDAGSFRFNHIPQNNY